MSCFRKAWSSLNFYKEYLYGFETLVFATSGILSMHKQLVTNRKGKFEIASYDPFNIVFIVFLSNKCSLGEHKRIYIYIRKYLSQSKAVICCQFFSYFCTEGEDCGLTT